MISFLADENFDNRIVKGLRRRREGVDIVRVQEVGLSGADDPTLLDWAAGDGRVVLTHDVETMTRFAYERVAAGLPMPGLFELTTRVPIGTAIEEIAIVAHCSITGEWEGQVHYLPLR